MRLLDTTALRLHYFPSTPPPYAILSHRWRDEEVTFQDLSVSTVSQLKGHAKFTSACAFARGLGCAYLWIDTCCIDKTSSAELSEALNSMFKWYKEAALCLAYLDDVEHEGWKSKLGSSEWWKRGWTLQELEAPGEVLFLSKEWKVVGTKTGMAERVAGISGVDEEVLLTGQLESVSVAGRMAWAAERETLKVEDRSYCLMGIFGINMPTLYGEGSNAFARLQEEILKKSDDQTIFAWGLLFDHSDSDTLPFPNDFEVDSPHMSISLLAPSSGSFLDYTPLRRLSSSAIARNLSCASLEGEIAITNHGTRLRIPKLALDEKRGIYLAFLPCEDENGNIMAIYLHRLHGNHFARIGSYGPPDLLSIPYRLIDSSRTESKEYIYVTRDPPKPFLVSVLALVNGNSIAEFCNASGFEVKGKGSVGELNTWDDSANTVKDCDFDVQELEPTYLLLRHEGKRIGICIAFTIEPSRLARADRNLFSIKALLMPDLPEGISYPNTSLESIKHFCEEWKSRRKVDEAPVTNFTRLEIPEMGELTLLIMCEREPNWENVDGYNDCRYTATAQWTGYDKEKASKLNGVLTEELENEKKRDNDGRTKESDGFETKNAETRGLCHCAVI